jgi:hypothetical protein
MDSRRPLFGRSSDAPSSTVQRGGGRFQTAYSNLNHTEARTQTVTVGANGTITPHVINELRFNYSLSREQRFLTLDNFAGAVPPPDSVLFPQSQSSSNSFFGFFGDFNPFGLNYDVWARLQTTRNIRSMSPTVFPGSQAHIE